MRALTANRTKQTAALSSASGPINMTYSMNGPGILQANQNTGAAAVQGNSVALTSYGRRQWRRVERVQPAAVTGPLRTNSFGLGVRTVEKSAVRTPLLQKK